MALSLRSCGSCHRNALNAFISISGVSFHSSPLQSNQIRRTKRIGAGISIRTRSLTFSHNLQSTSQSESSVFQENVNTSDTSSSDTTKSQSSIPWYLQVETPEPPPHINTSPILASQEIPPIPTDAPPILEPILNHLSVTIGLENLSLLDLRSFSDPPPALGSNLFMILGTARSHKHLNTSADRFCRWLRSTYKLRPYADGLLGRNEMKLKLRRKTRRMKLAQSVGNTLAMTQGGSGGNLDDGITTGWICCNLGPVDGPIMLESGEGAVIASETPLSTKEEEIVLKEEEEEYINPAEDHFYAGFGSRSDAPKIVVQMFTEEKRLEMDLEGLWDIRLQRRANKSRMYSDAETDFEGTEEGNVDHGSRNEEPQQLKAIGAN